MVGEGWLPAEVLQKRKQLREDQEASSRNECPSGVEVTRGGSEGDKQQI
jgi:hypothetical protein